MKFRARYANNSDVMRRFDFFCIFNITMVEVEIRCGGAYYRREKRCRGNVKWNFSKAADAPNINVGLM